MGKVNNITPEEREQAIYTINKLGEEMTDERIDYYVQLRRNTLEHQEEKVIKEDINNVSEHNKEFAQKVLTYMRRSKSERQILLYSKKHIETLCYIRGHQYDIDYTPSLFGEAIRFMERKKQTTIHHLTGEDLANCLKDNKEELNNRRNEVEAERKNRNKRLTDIGERAVRLSKVVLIIGGILIFAPFFITGFGFNFFWYLIITGLAFFSFLMLGVDGCSKNEYSYVKSILIGFLIIGCVMYLWGPLNPNYNTGGEGSLSKYNEMPTKTQWTCVVCKKSFTYYEDEIGEHDKWKYWNGEKICYNCYGFRKSVNDALKESNSPYADYNH